jgi:hypothetical protein
MGVDASEPDCCFRCIAAWGEPMPPISPSRRHSGVPACEDRVMAKRETLMEDEPGLITSTFIRFRVSACLLLYSTLVAEL